MDCTKCDFKGCRKLSPCKDDSEQYINEYFSHENSEDIKNAAALVDNGKAGTLTRLEEILEYCRLKGHKRIGVAYCYAMEKEAEGLRDILEKSGFMPVMVSCTVDGISESRINQDKHNQVVSCNPLGQAYKLNSSDVDFVIIMGLCLGHDILFQKHVKSDFTVFIVKDRVLRHNPILSLKNGLLPEDEFIKGIGADFNLIKPEELRSELGKKEFTQSTYIIDLRGEQAYKQDHIDGAVNSLLEDLPGRYKNLLPDKNKEVIIYCNGGIQSIYAVMYLKMKGYKQVRSLSGGYSRYKSVSGG